MSRIRLKPLAEQVVVITGASSGIGLTTARAAARAGAKVMLVARGEDALRGAADALSQQAHVADFHVADVGNRDEVRRAAMATLARFGRIDTWINCAGVAIYAPLLETPEEEHQRLFRTNYFGVVHGCQVAVEHLRKSGGALITVGSIAGDIPSPVMGAYAASKHAVKGYVDSLRIEIDAAALPISVTLIKPSGINTPIAEHAANHMAGEALIPPPVYDPALVANAILDAAITPRRAVTVGGIGRLQVLAGTHFPGLLARFGGLIAPLLVAPDGPKTPDSNLDHAGAADRERSAREHGRKVSNYALSGGPAAIVAVSLLGVAIIAWRNRRPFMSGSST